MQKLELGRSGIMVSEICLGTMYFGIKVAEELSFRFLDIYYEQEGRFLDTANKYATWVPGFPEPVGEKLLGRWLQSRRHKDIFVATKLGFPYLDVPQSLGREIIVQEVEKSLQNLGVECIDLLYAHVDDYNTPQEEYMEAFAKLVAAGKVREIGISNVMTWRITKANMLARSNGWKEFSCVQARLSLLWPQMDADFARQTPASFELLDYTRREGVRMICYSPFLQGCFGRADRDIPEGYVSDYNRETVEIVRGIGQKKGISGNLVVACWMLEQGFIPVLTGSTEEQIRENLQAATGVLSQEEVACINERFYPKWVKQG